jgi:60 kDa SS-A/Ro ribonucleoprotein
MDYSQYDQPHRDKKQTPQDQPIPGKDMVKNAAGGYVFKLDKWAMLDRFLILGTERGSYYVSERNLTTQNIENVKACLKEDASRVVDRAVEISISGRAAKNDPALFVLALAASHDNPTARQKAFDALPDVARMGTHLFQFVQFVTGQRGWGRALKRAVANWYNCRPVDKIAFQTIKYKERNGWNHRSLLKLAHPFTEEDTPRDKLYQKIIYKKTEIPSDIPELEQYAAALQAANETDVKILVKLIEKHKLPHEVINRKMMDRKEVWQALIKNMPVGALIRNLGRMTSLGVLDSHTAETQKVTELLSEENIQRSRIHPITLLSAFKAYTEGHGFKGATRWTPTQRVIDVLDAAFYYSFKNVRASNKRILMAVDISGSMFGAKVIGNPQLDAATVAAAMSLITLQTEPNALIKGFTAGVNDDWRNASEEGFINLQISPRQRLDQILVYMRTLTMGATDCSLPMRWALNKKVPIDAFVIYTDNDTWYGREHPIQALKRYRNKMGIPSKFIVAATSATSTTINNAEDGGTLEVCGFDSAAPQLISDFIAE